ncbi:hypothetical protein H310_15256 [Aphanomyces invadans]|uniref:Pirin C-terminal domain-containing protein n=1 Tax=Aphanomyces invadans TaxID=157072 RepID=A0A024T8K2_9STRA|nr:hypothetical protein H310_15256 [Aphanomyces invadans]ETV89906.1 hypothetical protein H310_15256 [Aphanomyces invadans]|eukprot:XP_008881465.1 hypothetical protein H310_15256 [Aphanomyces invadans]
MTDPKYQEIPASGLPRAKEGNVEAIIIAGDMGEKANSRMSPSLHHNAFVYVISGSGRIGGESVEAHSVVQKVHASSSSAQRTELENGQGGNTTC